MAQSYFKEAWLESSNAIATLPSTLYMNSLLVPKQGHIFHGRTNQEHTAEDTGPWMCGRRIWRLTIM